MKTTVALSFFCILTLLTSCNQNTTPSGKDVKADYAKAAVNQILPSAKYTGSKSCRPCHERFYKLWEPSHHGKAMQPFTEELAKEHLTPLDKPIEVEGTFYEYRLEGGKGWIVQTGKEGDKRYEMVHAMGGKNMYFFLTPLEKGRLQVLPISYNVRTKSWFGTMGAMVRHFQGVEDEALHWRDPMMTFNTACYSCHVSQLSTNYDPKDGSYNTVWQEPGINCEVCHGPASAHIELYADKPKDFVPADGDMKIVKMRELTAAQRDETCAPCHAKMHAITEKFGPGDRYFDNHDLATFEDRDFYPDGRDLGENYTYTLWLTNKCVLSGKLECLHCHTSSGRNRHADNPNKACLPCHESRVKNPTKHTRHKADSKGNLCVSCHMPMTMFSRMQRSDHSLRPPTPEATIEFNSPNACNICHDDKSAEWSNEHVKKWHGDYQDEALHRARLIDAARKNDWSKLSEMLAYMKSPESDGIFVNSLIRLLGSCRDPRKGPVIRNLLKHPMPIVRSSAASGLRDSASEETMMALLEACSDSSRLVRIRAANALAIYPERMIPDDKKAVLAKATQELETSFSVRPDQWGYHYNRGNYLMDKEQFDEALEAYDTAHGLRNDTIMPLVNGSMAAARLKKPNQSLRYLEKAREIEPQNAGVLLNLGLVYSELNQPSKAREILYAGLKADPSNGQIAYNLGLLVMEEDTNEGLRLCRIAANSKPPRPDYAYALAFYLSRADQTDEAIGVLEKLAKDEPDYYTGLFFLGNLYQTSGNVAKAKALYQSVAERTDLPPQVRNEFLQAIQALK